MSIEQNSLSVSYERVRRVLGETKTTEHAIFAEAGSAGDPYAQPAPEYEYDQRVSW